MTFLEDAYAYWNSRFGPIPSMTEVLLNDSGQIVRSGQEHSVTQAEPAPEPEPAPRRRPRNAREARELERRQADEQRRRNQERYQAAVEANSQLIAAEEARRNGTPEPATAQGNPTIGNPNRVVGDLVFTHSYGPSMRQRVRLDPYGWPYVEEPRPTESPKPKPKPVRPKVDVREFFSALRDLDSMPETELRLLVLDMADDWLELNWVHNQRARNNGWCSEYEELQNHKNRKFKVLKLFGREHPAVSATDRTETPEHYYL